MKQKDRIRAQLGLKGDSVVIVAEEIYSLGSIENKGMLDRIAIFSFLFIKSDDTRLLT